VLGPTAEERVLVGTDLLHVDLVDARVQVVLDRGEVRFGIRFARELACDRVAWHQ
jgi:hypothetical protein